MSCLEETYGKGIFADYSLAYLSDEGMVLYNPETDSLAQCTRTYDSGITRMQINPHMSNLYDYLYRAIGGTTAASKNMYGKDHAAYQCMNLIKDRDKEFPYILMVFHKRWDTRNTCRKLLEMRLKYLGINVQTHEKVRSPNFSYNYDSFTQGLETLWLAFNNPTDYAMFVFHFHNMIAVEEK